MKRNSSDGLIPSEHTLYNGVIAGIGNEDVFILFMVWRLLN